MNLFKQRQPPTTLHAALSRQYQDGVLVGRTWAILCGGMFSVALGLYAGQWLLSGLGAAAVIIAFLVIRHQGRAAHRDRSEFVERRETANEAIESAGEPGRSVSVAYISASGPVGVRGDEADVPWIPSAEYRADCAVGQLRPTGMSPCSAEPPIERTRHRFNDVEQRCEQHTYPTLAQCATRADDLMQKAAAARGRALSTEHGWEREQRLAASSWLEQRAGHYRLAPGLGMTADPAQLIEPVPPVEWLGPEFLVDTPAAGAALAPLAAD